MTIMVPFTFRCGSKTNVIFNDCNENGTEAFLNGSNNKYYHSCTTIQSVFHLFKKIFSESSCPTTYYRGDCLISFLLHFVKREV